MKATATTTKTTAAKTAKATYPKDAALEAQRVTGEEFGKTGRAYLYVRIGSGELYWVEKARGTGRTTCTACGHRIADGADALLCAWKPRDHAGYFLPKFHAHAKGGCAE